MKGSEKEVSKMIFLFLFVIGKSFIGIKRHSEVRLNKRQPRSCRVLLAYAMNYDVIYFKSPSYNFPFSYKILFIIKLNTINNVISI